MSAEKAWRRAEASVQQGTRPRDGSIVRTIDDEPIGIVGEGKPTKRQQAKLDREWAAWKTEQDRLTEEVTPDTPFEALFRFRDFLAHAFDYAPDSLLSRYVEGPGAAKTVLLHMLSGLGKALYHVPIVYWRSGMLEAATANAEEAFRGEIVRPDDLAFTSALWCLDHPVTLEEHYLDADGRPTMAIAGFLGATPTRVVSSASFYTLGIGHEPSIADTRRLKVYLLNAFLLVAGEPPSDDNECGLLAMCRFLQEKLVAQARARIPRGERRRAEKAGKPEPVIRVVTLRKRERREIADGETHDVDWSCHWTVRGHWRKNGFTEGAPPIYVHSYVKGDMDKPFKPPKETLYDVRR